MCLTSSDFWFVSDILFFSVQKMCSQAKLKLFPIFYVFHALYVLTSEIQVIKCRNKAWHFTQHNRYHYKSVQIHENMGLKLIIFTQGIVFTHGVRMGRRAGGGKKFVWAVSQKP